MLTFVRALAAVALVTVLASLPASTQCDTSYYERYYAARRMPPLKRATMIQCNFTVNLDALETLASFEQVAIVGDVNALGSWSAQRALLLNRTEDYRVWSGSLELPVNSTVNYRYFIAAVDSDTARSVHIRRWESHVTARQFHITASSDGQRSDTFGWISPDQREVQRGWLSVGHIVQFKLFHNPLQVNRALREGEQLRLKVQPIEPQMLTPILPSARAFTEYVRMEYGNSLLREQPEFGVPYAENDVLIFHTVQSELTNVAYLLKLFAKQEGSDLVRLIGYQYVYPHMLIGSEGQMTLNLISPVWLNSIGSLNLQYLIINPMPKTESGSEAVDFRSTFATYWRQNWTELDVGHRGLGKSLTVAGSLAAPIIENTVASMKASGELGADIVEFDVMLTSDLVPVIYHDYQVYVCMDSKTPTTKNDLTPVLIKDVTYEQLKNLKTYQVVSNKIIEYPSHNSVDNVDQRLFPLFEDFLTKVNKSLGFDIEIKWPQLKTNGEWESEQTIDKNTYIDRILDVMNRFGCGRLSFFTSFDADICAILRFKQNMYPVMFLSSSKDNVFVDPRTNTILDTVNTVQAFELAGIVPNAVHIKSKPQWIDLAKKQQQKVFLWGGDLKDTESIEWFKAQAPTGVIYDRLDLWLPMDKQNNFEMEDDLPQYFQLQCRDGDGGNGNSTVGGLIDFL